MNAMATATDEFLVRAVLLRSAIGYLGRDGRWTAEVGRAARFSSRSAARRAIAESGLSRRRYRLDAAHAASCW